MIALNGKRILVITINSVVIRISDDVVSYGISTVIVSYGR
jgi:hypothetical protein